MSLLNSTDIENIRILFVESILESISSFGNEYDSKLKMFIIETSRLEKPYLLVSDEGMERAIEIVFSNKMNRDLIFEINYRFFTRLGNKEVIKELIKTISFSNCFINKQSLMPLVVSDRLPTEEQIQEKLLANPWLIILVLIPTFTISNLIDSSK